MDSNLGQRRRGIEEKIPEMKKTLSMVEFLLERQVRRLVLRAACTDLCDILEEEHRQGY